jgi:hypothetical protein
MNSHHNRAREAALEGVAAYLADDDAAVHNVTDAAVTQDALGAALNLTALAANAITALAAATGRDPSDVLRTLHAARSGVEVVYPGAMDEHDWVVREAKGWIEVTVRWTGGEKPITFYDPTRLAQEVQSALEQSGYFAERALVVVPTLSKEAIETVVAQMAQRDFIEL